MREQPIPQVTRADVERVIRRDFPQKVVAEALSLLDACDADSGAPIPRVQLAVLKMADGDLTRLKRFIEDAKLDYRDVLGWAEFPQYSRTVPGPGQPPHVDQIIEADWKQYQSWLTR